LNNTAGICKRLQIDISVDDAIHDLLSDEYEEDIKAFEEYIYRTKRAIQKTIRRMDNGQSASTARLSIHG